jgi:hypothetical protein
MNSGTMAIFEEELTSCLPVPEGRQIDGVLWMRDSDIPKFFETLGLEGDHTSALGQAGFRQMCTAARQGYPWRPHLRS